MKKFIIAVFAVAAAAVSVQASTERIASTNCYVDWSIDEGALVCRILVREPGSDTQDLLMEGSEPAWSRDGTKIAITGTGRFGGSLEGEISVLNVTTGTLVNLTNHPAYDHSPAWSPDGATIAFASDRGGANELYVMNADGSGVTRLTDNVGFWGQPTWSSDGGRIAFNCVVESGNQDICAINGDGSGFVRLTSDPAWDSNPDWSPVDGRIAFGSSRFNGITIMEGDGSGARPLAAGRYGWKPTWSPDGTRIAFEWGGGFACQDDYCSPPTYVINADGTGDKWPGGGTDASWTASTPARLLAPPLASFWYGWEDWWDTLTVPFDARSSWDNEAIATYSWNYGDGQSDSGARVTHKYAAEGTYTVTLTVTDNDGFTASQTKTANIGYKTFGSVGSVRTMAAGEHGLGGYPCPLDPTLTCVMSGLDSPRGLAFGPEGALYVAEAGRGAGPVQNPSQDPACFPFGGLQVCYGPTGAISRVWRGSQEKIATGLPSIAMPNGNRGRGPHDISFQGRGGAYVTIGLEGDPAIRNLPQIPELAGLGSLVHVAASGEWRFIADIAAFEVANNPDGYMIGGLPVLDSNPFGLLALPGERVIADAGANALLRADANGEISLLATFPSRGSIPPRPSFAPKPFNEFTDAVPTSVVVGPDGALYISELTGIPFTNGRANVYRLDPGADLPHTFTLEEAFLTGFKMIVDMTFDDQGNLYVLEHATGQFQMTGPGVLIRVEPDKSKADLREQYNAGTRSVVIDNLQRPTSVVVGPDGALYLSIRGLTAGGGEVIRIPHP